MPAWRLTRSSFVTWSAPARPEVMYDRSPVLYVIPMKGRRSSGRVLGGAVACLVLAAGVQARAVSVSGSVAYDGLQTGAALCVVAAGSVSNWNSGSVVVADPTTGAYVVTNLAVGTNCWLRAYLDINGDGLRQQTEPGGSYDLNPLSVTGDHAGVGIVVSDTAYDFQGWTNAGNTRLWAPEDGDYYRALVSGSNYTVSLDGAGVGGRGGSAIQLATNGAISFYVRLAKGAGDGRTVFNTMPRPGRRYRISFDARSDAVNRPLKVHWYNISWLSSNTQRNVTHFYQPEYVLLGTNWQTYSREIYLDHDEDFNRFGAAALVAPYFDMSFYPPEPGMYALDNVRMSEVSRDFPLAGLDNPGFERGFYGWGDDPAWAHTGTGEPDTESQRAHWAVSTNNPHSGRRCMTIVFPPWTNILWTFEPRLFTGGLQLERGENYLLSYWRRDSAPVVHATTAYDLFSSGVGRRAFHDPGTNWTRIVIPTYRYGEKFANTNFWVNAGPFAYNALQVRVDSVRFPWTRQVWVDDFRLERVDEEVARAVATNGAGSYPPWVPDEEDPSPYFLSTAFSPQAPFQMLSVTSRLDIPFTVERRNPDAADGGTLTVLISDYVGQGVHTQHVAFALTGETCQASCLIEGFDRDGLLPEGLYTYEISHPEVAHRATDRFFVRDLPAFLDYLPAGEGLLGFDRPDLVKAMFETSPVPKMVLGDYDRDHFMKLFADIGGRDVRLWIFGVSVHELDMLEEVVDQLVPAGFKPLVAINGYVGETNAYRLTSSGLPSAWNETDWNRYISNLAVRFEGKVRRWHVANEPYGWSAQTYMRVLTNTCTTFKSVDTNVIVHAFEQGLAPAAWPFLVSCYQDGAAAFADVVDYHSYYDLAAEELFLKQLQQIVRTGEGGPTGGAPGIVYMGSTNCPTWHTEYGSLWSKLAPGNLVLPVERDRASILLSKMLMARAYDVKKYFHFNVRPSFQDNHMFLQPVHASAALPAVCLQYAACATFASEMTGRDLARVYVVDRARVFEFGPREPGGATVVAAWATAWHPPVAVAEDFPDVELRRMDGSRQVVRRLDLTSEPVFLNPTNGTPYDWSIIFGTNSVPVR